MCAKRLGITTLAAKRAIQRLEAKLGLAFVSIEPYALYTRSTTISIASALSR